MKNNIVMIISLFSLVNMSICAKSKAISRAVASPEDQAQREIDQQWAEHRRMMGQLSQPLQRPEFVLPKEEKKEEEDKQNKDKSDVAVQEKLEEANAEGDVKSGEEKLEEQKKESIVEALKKLDQEVDKDVKKEESNVQALENNEPENNEPKVVESIETRDEASEKLEVKQGVVESEYNQESIDSKDVVEAKEVVKQEEVKPRSRALQRAQLEGLV